MLPNINTFQNTKDPTIQTAHLPLNPHYLHYKNSD